MQMNLQSEFFYAQVAVFQYELSIMKVGTFSAKYKVAYKAYN